MCFHDLEKMIKNMKLDIGELYMILNISMYVGKG